jgi:glycerol-3-phosphate cytidylyltransferase-like family protein
LFEATIENYLTDESNVFASSRMVGNAEVAPVDTVAPDAPSDTTEVGTPIQPQAITEDSIQQETTQQQEATETEQQTNAE